VKVTSSTATTNSIKTTTFHGVGRKEIGLQFLPQPDYLDFTLPPTHVALITNEGTELTIKVQQALEAKGNKVVLLNQPEVVNNPAQNKSVTLASNSDEAIAAALQTIEQQYGKVGTFIHLHPHLEWRYTTCQFLNHQPNGWTIRTR